MNRSKGGLACGWMLIATALSCGNAFSQTDTQRSIPDVDWPTYGADLAHTRYRPLDQINGANFGKLEVAWRFKTDNIGSHPEFKLEGTPLEAKGVIYATAGTRRGVVALDAVTGELLWVYGYREGARGEAAPRKLSGRGLSYWTDGKEERIVYVTPGYRLIALDAKTGRPVASFGEAGVVDLKLNDDQTIEPDLTTGEIGLHSAPTIAGDTIIVGAAFSEGNAPPSIKNNKGYVRGFDVRTGKRLWIFHTIPWKGEVGYDTWLGGSAEYTGNTGAWTQITADEELGLAYLPVESPTSDFFGGHRPGNNLFAETLVCVDLKTGERKWHFQLVHHPLWDLDIAAPPMLMDIKVGGKIVKAVAVPSKQSLLYTFDRITGKPIWPIPEKPVEKGTVPGEWYSPTQPIPSKPAAYSRNGIAPSDLIDYTPALREQALKIVSNYKIGPVFTPPVLSQQPAPLATLLLGSYGGGSNWPGGAFDPETHMAYFHACNACLAVLGLVPNPKPNPDPAKRAEDVKYFIGFADLKSHGTVNSQMQAYRDKLTVQGMPLIKPPYGVITAVDMDKGAIKWQIPHGDTPDSVRNNPALKGIAVPRTGQPAASLGILATKTLIIAGDGMVTTTPDHPRGALLHAYDKTTGAELASVWMPAPQSGSPMTYSVGGKQYIVVAVSGGAYSGEYIAFTLPSNE